MSEGVKAVRKVVALFIVAVVFSVPALPLANLKSTRHFHFMM